MFEQDYIMRLISEIIRMLLNLILHIDTKSKEQLDFEKEENKISNYDQQKYEKLLYLVDAGKINEAENILLEETDQSNLGDLELAFMFYTYLNEKEDEYLEQCNYSRTEITQGIRHISGIYGYDGLAGSLINLFLGGIYTM
jgi:hypothetical protein